MSARFEELDWRQTPMGDVSLRRRFHPLLKVDVYEVLLGDEHLMSSIFTVAEEELARLGLAATTGSDLDVVVGGLGLGYTARAALEDPRVRSLLVIEAMTAVIEWHADGLLPEAVALSTDARCQVVEGDFFTLTALPDRVHAVLLDIDHTPRHVLHPSHAAFYEQAGLRRLANRLHPGGVFALWSDEPPDDAFLAVLATVFATARAHVVPFDNPLTGGQSANTVYVAVGPGAGLTATTSNSEQT